MRNPVNTDYQCPFINSTCVKRGHRTSGPYPVCSIHRNLKNPQVICTCPKRFYEADFLEDVVSHCWKGTPPENPHFVHEVKMADFGMVDFVVADIDPTNGNVIDFVSAELQAVDLTGSVNPAYEAILNNTTLDRKPNYGVNWANVRKRYVAQLITKGFFHHHWGTRIISVIQTPLYEAIRSDTNFDEMPPDTNCNIVFMLYDYAETDQGRHKLIFDKAIGTRHNSLMMGALYRTPPPKDQFCAKILERIQADGANK